MPQLMQEDVGAGVAKQAFAHNPLTAAERLQYIVRQVALGRMKHVVWPQSLTTVLEPSGDIDAHGPIEETICWGEQFVSFGLVHRLETRRGNGRHEYASGVGVRLQSH